MNFNDLAVLVISLIAVLSAAYSVISGKLLRAAFGFAACLFSIGFIYMFLNQTFLGLVQIFLYVGGVAVLIVFAYITALSVTEAEKSKSYLKIAGSAIGFLTGVILILVFFELFSRSAGVVYRQVSIREIGEMFMTNYLFEFEVISVLLLTAFVSAAVFILKGRK